MNRELFNEIVVFLTPYMDSPARRQALVNTALYGCPVLTQITWEGDARTFTVHLVTVLVKYGECEEETPSIVTLLESMRSEVGATPRMALDELIRRTKLNDLKTQINELSARINPTLKTDTPHLQAPIIPPMEQPQAESAVPGNQPASVKSGNWFEKLGCIAQVTIGFEKLGCIAQVAIGIVGVMVALACGYLALPPATQQDLQRLIGMLPTATTTPTLSPTPEPSATLLEPTAAFTATFTSAPPSDTPTDTPTDAPTIAPTDTPTNTTPPTDLPTAAPTVAQTGGVSLSLSRDQNLFVVYAPQNPLAGLGNIAFRYTIGDTTRTTRTLSSFPAFGLDFGALTQPSCFVFRLQGDNTPLPMDCQSSGTLVFTQSLANADVFWRDGFGQSLTLLVMQGETQIGLCGAGNAACAVGVGTISTQLVATVTQNEDWTPIIQSFNGVEMVLVPPGEFTIGSTNGYADETPTSRWQIVLPFWIDRYEVTNIQFEQLGGIAQMGSNWPDENRPRENISWFEARDYCLQRGGRLPTEAEWEFAARGPSNFEYPWGDNFDSAYVVYIENSAGQTALAGSRPDGMSWVGAMDMSGNVWEWVSTAYQRYPYRNDSTRENNLTNAQRVIRGGAFQDTPFDLRAAHRFGVEPTNRRGNNGFRCVRDYVEGDLNP